MLEEHRFHLSLSRPLLIAGAEPAAVAVEVLTAGGLLFGVGFHVSTIVLAVFYMTVVHSVMTRVAGSDADLSKLYLRSLRAGDYYPAHGMVRAGLPAVQAAASREG